MMKEVQTLLEKVLAYNRRQLAVQSQAEQAKQAEQLLAKMQERPGLESLLALLRDLRKIFAKTCV